jgi:hypothetical protein
MEQAQQEGVVLLEAGLKGRITFRNFRAPGRYHGWRRQWFSGSIVLTRQHLLAFAYSKPLIAVAWSDRKTRRLKCEVEGQEKLSLQYDASVFNEDWSGIVTILYSTPMAQEIARQIRKLAR